MTTELSWGIAFFAGLLSFFSPCVLPLVPAYICYISGESLEALKEQRAGRVILFSRAILFILGFSSVFICLGASVSLLGNFLLAYRELFRRIGGIIMIILGLHLSGILPFKFLLRHKGASINNRAWGNLGALLVGATFAFAWMPCVGPILATILILAASTASVQKGILFLSFYSLGLALPFLIATFFLNYFLDLLKKFGRAAKTFSLIAAVGLIIAGVLIYLGYFNLSG